MPAHKVRPAALVTRVLCLLAVAATLAFVPACGSAKKCAPFMAKNEVAWAPPLGSEFNTEAYDHIVDNPFLLAAKFPLSTFSADVNTASYSNVRRFLLQEKKLPPKDAVRVAELVNYFEYDYPEPKDEHPIALATEVAACPWDTRCKLVKISLQAKKVAPEKMPPRNLVFLVDTSGSMNEPNRLPLLRESLKLLTAQLQPQDRVAIVAYAGSAGLVLPSTPGSQKEKIVAALDRLHAGGSTNGGAGIELAYIVFVLYFF
jgi:Ca-activated chloride channel family protein